jgi:hypothetical protein
LPYQSIIRNDTAGTWIKTVFDDEVTETADRSEALVFGDEHCAEVSVDYLNSTRDDCFSLVCLP